MSTPIPDWLEDIRRTEKPSVAPRQSNAPPPGLPLDWLEDIRQIEASLRGRAAPAVPPLPGALPPPVSPQQQGFDPATGRILDPVAYARWQKAQGQRRQQPSQQPTVSVAEAFLEAQRAIQTWVDADTNKSLVVGGDVNALRSCGSLQAVLHRFDGYGPVMQEKLWQRVVFLVDNRQKFFKAFAAKR